MRCSFCKTNDQMEEDIPFCESCWQDLERGNTPPMDFMDYFTDGLESKLRQVDTLLFTLPSSHFLWYLKGHLEHEMGDTKKALRSLNSSLNYNERFGDSWIRLGLVYSDLHREDDAIESYEKGLEHPLTDPTNLIDAGIPLLAAGNPRLASRLLARALDLVPQDDRALVNYGRALVQLGELEKAKTVFERSLQLYPHNEEVLRGMAHMMLKMEDHDTAAEMYFRILDQHPNDFEALLAMGELSLKKGELGQAMKYYKEVRDLDVSISWPGIVRFILSVLKGKLSKNQDQNEYREDLKKEYDNILRYIKELDSRTPSGLGPEALNEIEGLVRVIESSKVTVKEQMVQIEEFMKRYEDGNPFRTHLEERLDLLSDYLRDGRFFDAKQIALELSPFLAEARSSDPKGPSKLKESVKRRLKEFEEVGLGLESFKNRIEEADALEREGKLERSLYMYKELESALEEHYQVNGKRYYESKMKEMRDLLDKARDQFDVTGLTRLYESFGNLFRKGPIAIRDAYMEFLKRYEEDSASYHLKEGERFLKEVQYKMVIMEKEGSDVSELKLAVKRVRSILEEGGPPKRFFTESFNLLEHTSELELRHKVKGMKEKLSSLDLLLKQMDELGLDNELAKNVEPVRKVIDRSLASENYKLAEVLTNEVMENVERVLRENYLGTLKASLLESKGEIERLKGFNVRDEDWDGLIEAIERVLEDPSHSGSMMDAVRDLAKIQYEVHGFYIDRLPLEIDLKVDRCRKLLEDAVSQGLNMKAESEVLRKLMVNVKRISSFEILQEASKFQDELEARMEKELRARTSQLVSDLKSKIERYSSMGLPKSEMLSSMAAVNRAEVLLESHDPSSALRSAQEALRTVSSFETTQLKVRLDERTAHLRELEAAIDKLGAGLPSLTKDIASLSSLGDLEGRLSGTDALIKRAQDHLADIVKKRIDSLKHELYEVVQNSSGAIADEEARTMENEMNSVLSSAIVSEVKGLPAKIERLSSSVRGLSESVRERMLLERCSTALETLAGLDDEKARQLKAMVREIIKDVRMGHFDGAVQRIDSIMEESADLKAALEMQRIESVLSDLEELDDLSKEVFRSIEGDEFAREKESISSMIAGLLQRTSLLYDRPEPDKVRDMSQSISKVREAIIHLENRWRAKRRLQTLENVGGMDLASNDPELTRSIADAKESFENGDWNRFFRTWERIEAHLSKPQVKQLKKEVEHDDKAIQVLVRGRGPKRADLGLPDKGKGRSFGGIKKLAKDMAEKRRLMEAGPKEEMTVPERSLEPPERPADAGANVPGEVGAAPVRVYTSATQGIIGAADVAPAEPYRVVNTDEARLAERLKGMVSSILHVNTTDPSVQSSPGSAPSTAMSKIEDAAASGGPESAAVKAPSSTAETPHEVTKEKNIADIARMIAGSRIEQLKRTESVALKERTDERKEHGDASPKAGATGSELQYTCMMDEFLELDTKPKATKSREKEAMEIRRKLECFFEKLPQNLRIDEAKAFYKKGVTLMEIDDSSGAIREFRLAISSAIKIGKLHADLTKALKAVRGTMDKQTSVGPEFLRIEKLYLKADDALNHGSLEDCAKYIKAIRNLLAAQMR